MLGCLGKQELNQRDADLGLFIVKLLVSAEFVELFVIIGLAKDLLGNLSKHQLELNSTDPVQNRDLSECPLRAVDASTEIESHFY